MTPTFTVLIGSAGRDSLKYTLDSIAKQDRIPDDRVIVCFDSYENEPSAELIQFVHSYGPWAIACEYDSGYHFYGVEQVNFALKHRVHEMSTHVLTLGDDDVLTDRAYSRLRPVVAAYPDQAVLFRFVAPWRELLWDVPQMRRSRISGCCIAAPKQFVGLMDTKTQNPDGTEYKEHDFDWMQAIIRESGQEPYWLDEVLVIARPDEDGKGGVKQRGLSRCWHCQTWRWLEDVSVTETHCPKCRVVLQPAELLGVS